MMDILNIEHNNYIVLLYFKNINKDRFYEKKIKPTFITVSKCWTIYEMIIILQIWNFHYRIKCSNLFTIYSVLLVKNLINFEVNFEGSQHICCQLMSMLSFYLQQNSDNRFVKCKVGICCKPVTLNKHAFYGCMLLMINNNVQVCECKCLINIILHLY